MARDTASFLRLMNQRNDEIAAREAEDIAKTAAVGPDPVQMQRDKEYREKWGQLRARPRGRAKTKHARNAFGHVNVSPDY